MFSRTSLNMFFVSTNLAYFMLLRDYKKRIGTYIFQDPQNISLNYELPITLNSHRRYKGLFWGVGGKYRICILSEWDSPATYYLDEPRRHYAKRNKPATEGQIVHDSTYIKYPKQPNSQKQEVEWWLLGTKGRKKWRVAVPWI